MTSLHDSPVVVESRELAHHNRQRFPKRIVFNRPPDRSGPGLPDADTVPTPEPECCDPDEMPGSPYGHPAFEA